MGDRSGDGRCSTGRGGATDKARAPVPTIDQQHIEPPEDVSAASRGGHGAGRRDAERAHRGATVAGTEIERPFSVPQRTAGMTVDEDTPGRHQGWYRGSGTVRGSYPAVRRPNERWSLDIVVDRLAGGRRFQILMLVDTANLTSPAMVVDFALTGERIVAVLDRLAKERDLPDVISVDKGRPFASRLLAAWAGRHGVNLEYPQAARATFAARLRTGCLARHRFADLTEARQAIEEWRIANNAAAPAARPN